MYRIRSYWKSLLFFKLINFLNIFIFYLLKYKMDYFTNSEGKKISLNKLVGVVSNWKNESLENTWLYDSLITRFGNLEKLDITNFLNNECTFLIFLGESIDLNINIELKVPYIILAYRADTLKEHNYKFIKNALLTTVVSNSTNKLFNSSLIVCPNPVFYNLLPSIKYIKNYKSAKIVFRDPFQLKKSEALNNYIGTVPYESGGILFSKLRTLVEKFYMSDYDLLDTKFDVESIQKKFKITKLMICFDYYSILLAIQLKIPCIAIDVNPSIRELMVDCGLQEFCIKCSDIPYINNILEKLEHTYVTDKIVYNMENYINVLNSKCKDLYNMLEDKILNNVKYNEIFDKPINNDTEIKPFNVTFNLSLNSMKDITNNVTNIIHNDDDNIDKVALLNKMKLEFESFHKISLEKIKQLEDDKRRKKQEEEEQKLILTKLNKAKEEQLKKEQELLNLKMKEKDKDIKIKELLSIDFTKIDPSIDKSVYINRKLNEILRK